MIDSQFALMTPKYSERLSDNVAFRATPAQRRFLEDLAKDLSGTIGDAARGLIDRAMENEA